MASHGNSYLKLKKKKKKWKQDIFTIYNILKTLTFLKHGLSTKI